MVLNGVGWTRGMWYGIFGFVRALQRSGLDLILGTCLDLVGSIVRAEELGFRRDRLHSTVMRHRHSCVFLGAIGMLNPKYKNSMISQQICFGEKDCSSSHCSNDMML